MPEPWESADVAQHPLLSHVLAVWAGLKSLGIVKAGESWRVWHKHDCPTGKPPHDYAQCSCPGGPELGFADWNELQPQWHIIERFIN